MCSHADYGYISVFLIWLKWGEQHLLRPPRLPPIEPHEVSVRWRVCYLVVIQDSFHNFFLPRKLSTWSLHVAHVDIMYNSSFWHSSKKKLEERQRAEKNIVAELEKKVKKWERVLQRNKRSISATLIFYKKWKECVWNCLLQVNRYFASRTFLLFTACCYSPLVGNLPVLSLPLLESFYLLLWE